MDRFCCLILASMILVSRSLPVDCISSSTPPKPTSCCCTSLHLSSPPLGCQLSLRFTYHDFTIMEWNIHFLRWLLPLGGSNFEDSTTYWERTPFSSRPPSCSCALPGWICSLGCFVKIVVFYYILQPRFSRPWLGDVSNFNPAYSI